MSQSSAVNAEIITVGTEILLGEITDTNSVYIARLLRDYGINLYFMTSVGDNRKRIAEAVQIASSRANLVIVCGGLGPTVDDMTRQGIADACGLALVFHQDLLDQISARFASFRVRMTENNLRQAYLPEGAVAIENPVGTAPAFHVNHQGVDIVALPGVPREMKYLMTEKVVPYLKEKHQLGIIKARILKTAGIGESMLDELIGTTLLEASNPTVGLAAHSGQIDVRITAKAETLDDALAMITGVEQQLMNHIGQFVYGYDDDKLETVLCQSLERANLKLSVLEAGTDMALARLLNKTSAHVIAKADSVAHPSELKAIYDPDNVLTLRDLAAKVATQTRLDTDAAFGIVILVNPEVNEGGDANEATAVAVASEQNVRARVYGFGGQADFAPQWVSTWAMSQAWGMLREMGHGTLDV